tara:strand:+ start:9017 stop:12619 length:3603 start_codon:yes stop_codon:yes gene_type:complete
MEFFMRQPKRFVGLHAHSGFSTFDGLSYPQDHIDYVRNNNMSAWALTDHGHMNGFAHAYLHTQKLNKAGANFKFIPGCEMYVHPDLDVWRLDYEIKQAAKRGDASALKMLREERERIQTPLLAITDGDDEIVDIAVGSAGQTIENEEETKSGKFFDPIKRRHHLVVLPRTSVGLERLFGLVSRGYAEGFYRFPRVDYKMIKEASKGGHLMLSTACLGGPLSYEVFKQIQGVEFDDLNQNLLDDETLLNKILLNIGNSWDQLTDAVGDAAFLELQFNKLSAQHLVNRALIEFANRNSLQDKLIVTCDSHYSSPDHWKERELYKKLGWLNYKDIGPDSLPKNKEDLKCELYPKNANQVWETFLETTKGMKFYDSDIICDAIERTDDIAYDMIGDINPDCSMKLPSYTIPKGKTADQALIESAKKGIIKKGLHKKPEYVARLKEELGVISDKEFSEYFLTTKAIIDLAKTKMRVGPGRGSGAGSLVNYVLGITDVDPLEYGLLFSRFMDPTRTDYPDIDTDIGDRDKLLALLRAEYGKENIIPISNYNRFQLKSLVKDISRFYGIEFQKVNKALGPLERDIKAGLRRDKVNINGPITPTLEWAMAYSESFRDLAEEHPEIIEPIGVLFQQNKSLGRHAGGVIVSERIKERMPVIMAKGELQTPWVEGASYKHLEHFGWIKFDLLGLETLRIIDRAIELILQRKEGIETPDYGQVNEWFEKHMSNKAIDFNDQEVYKVYAEARWAGIFQCTNHGAQRLFKRAKPTSIEEIAALTAIYRPGPLAMHIDKKYLKSKANPEDVIYKHPLLEEILSPTFGHIVFQEQTMAIVNRVAGIPLKECNSVRKMMKPQQSSGDAAKKAKALESRIISGFIDNGMKDQDAHELYSDIMKFTAYSFNKSHAISYAINSFYCAWMMTHYEEEWLCAYLESMEGNADKRSKAFSEVAGMGYKIVPLDINEAAKTWTILPGKRFMPSFMSCKGVGEAAVDEIIANRPYTDIKTMLWNEDGKWRHSKFNKKALESLVRVKAFRSMENLIGQEFESYKHMLETIVPNWSSIRKSLKRNAWEGYDNFKVLREENRGLQEFTKREIIINENELFGYVSPETIITEEQINKLRNTAQNIRPVCEWDKEWLYWFVPTQVTPKKTKNNKYYLRMKITSNDGNSEWLNCWGWNGRTAVEPYTICVAVINNQEGWGKSCRWSKLKLM